MQKSQSKSSSRASQPTAPTSENARGSLPLFLDVFLVVLLLLPGQLESVPSHAAGVTAFITVTELGAPHLFGEHALWNQFGQETAEALARGVNGGVFETAGVV